MTFIAVWLRHSVEQKCKSGNFHLKSTASYSRLFNQEGRETVLIYHLFLLLSQLFGAKVEHISKRQ